MLPRRTILRVFVEPLAVAIVLAFAVRAVVRVYAIPSRSMEPTLRVGDHIAVTPYWSATPRRGDVVVFRSPMDASEVLVKRVVAVPGELIESRTGRVTIGGHALAEPYLVSNAETEPIVPQVVPQDCYFVMGDNRALSLDSRNWGVLPGGLILGRARMVLWSGGRRNDSPAAQAATAAARASSERRERLRFLLPIR